MPFKRNNAERPSEAERNSAKSPTGSTSTTPSPSNGGSTKSVLSRVRTLFRLSLKQPVETAPSPPKASTKASTGGIDGKVTSKDLAPEFLFSSHQHPHEGHSPDKGDRDLAVAGTPSSSCEYTHSSMSPHSKTVVLDLDDTLVWSEAIPCPAHADLKERGIFKIELPDGSPFYFKIHERPGARELLRALSERHFELVVFTAGTKKYADTVVDHLLSDTDPTLIARRFYREDCKKEMCFNVETGEHKPGYVKDLRLVRREEELGQVVICDDNWVSYNMQTRNACPIKKWGPTNKREPVLDYSDRDLYVLATYLTEHIYNLTDVRLPKIGVYESWASDQWEMRRLAERKCFINRKQPESSAQGASSLSDCDGQHNRCLVEA